MPVDWGSCVAKWVAVSKSALLQALLPAPLADAKPSVSSSQSVKLILNVLRNSQPVMRTDCFVVLYNNNKNGLKRSIYPPFAFPLLPLCLPSNLHFLYFPAFHCHFTTSPCFSLSQQPSLPGYFPVAYRGRCHSWGQ